MCVDAAHPSDFDPVRMEPHRIEDTVCRTDDGVEKKQLRKFPFKVLFEAVLFFTYIVSCSGKRFFMLFNVIPSVEMLWNIADVVGGMSPNTPAPMSPELMPTMER